MVEKTPGSSQDVEVQIESANSEFERYTENLRYGTPEYLAFSDHTAMINSKSGRDFYSNKITRAGDLGGDAARERVAKEVEESKKDAKDDLRIVNETIRVREDTVDGYYEAKKGAEKLFQELQSAEELRLKSEPGTEIVHSSEGLQRNPKAFYASDLRIKADQVIQKKFAGKRESIIQRGRSS